MDDSFFLPALPAVHRNGIGFNWTEEDDRILTAMWPTHTAGAISRVMFPPRTRNAILGRAHRIGLLMKTQKGSKGGVAEPRVRKVRKRRKPAPRPQGCNMTQHQPMFEILQEPQGWSPIGVSLLDADRHHCRAVIGSSASAVAGIAMFCGHPTVQGQPFLFCDYHMELFTEPHGRRRPRRAWRHWRYARK